MPARHGLRAFLLLSASLLSALLLSALLSPQAAFAQQKIGYVDSQYILSKTPEYATIQQQVDRLARDFQAEIDEKRKEVDALFQTYQSRELLYTNEERKRRRDEIARAEAQVEDLRMRYFGPEGELFKKQEELMRPLQERILVAIEEVAKDGGYDYVFDRSGDFLFLFAREQFNLSDQVLIELGIDLESNGAGVGQ